MRRDELLELHNITHVRNVPSLLSRGILSYRLARNVDHESVADPAIQDRRERRPMPGMLPLHDYASLYINARNKMMYTLTRTWPHEALCVLRVDTSVLDLPRVVVADQNASSNWAVLRPAASGLRYIDKEMVFARRWDHHPDQRDRWRHGAVMCAEVLVPQRVEPKYISGLYVPCEEGSRALDGQCGDLPITINPDLFFLGYGCNHG
jgi:hypothetical protein